MPTTMQARARVAALTRHRPDDQASIAEAKRALLAASAEDYIKRLVDSAPKLTDAQRARLAVLLLNGAA